MVFGTDVTDTMCLSHTGEHVLAGNVAPSLEQRVAQRKTHDFTKTVSLAVSGSRNGQRGQRSKWEEAGVKQSEKIRVHLRSKGIHVLRRSHWVERCPIDQFEWPGPHP